MKTVSVKKRDLVQAIAYETHVDFDPEEWSWQVSLNPRAPEPAGRVMFVDHDSALAAGFYVDEQPFGIMAFTDLDGYRWGDSGSLDAGQPTDGKGLEAICIPDDVRARIEGSLRKHVDLGSDTYSIRYY